MSTSLTRGLNLLDILARAGMPVQLADLAEESGYSKSGVHGLLATLVDCGYAEHAMGGTYRLGFKAWQAASALPTAELVRVAQPIMEEVVEQIGEGAILGVLNGFHVVYVSLVPSRQAVRVHAEVGERILAHSTSTGLAVLAFQEPRYLEKWMPAKLVAMSSETIVDKDGLLSELERVRLRGYSINRGGWHADVGGVAAPIRLPSTPVTAGLCVALPRYRMTREWIGRVGPIVMGKAADIAKGLSSTALTVAESRAS